MISADNQEAVSGKSFSYSLVSDVLCFKAARKDCMTFSVSEPCFGVKYLLYRYWLTFFTCQHIARAYQDKQIDLFRFITDPEILSPQDKNGCSTVLLSQIWLVNILCLLFVNALVLRLCHFYGNSLYRYSNHTLDNPHETLTVRGSFFVLHFSKGALSYNGCTDIEYL